jgi:hypothetical protein
MKRKAEVALEDTFPLRGYSTGRQSVLLLAHHSRTTPHSPTHSLTRALSLALVSRPTNPTVPPGQARGVIPAPRPPAARGSHRGGGLGPSKWWWARVGPGKAGMPGMMLLWSGDPSLLQCSPCSLLPLLPLLLPPPTRDPCDTIFRTPT